MLLQIAAAIDWTTIIITLIGMVSAGGAVKIYNAWTKNKKDKRSESTADGIAFRENLLARVEDMSNKLEDMYEKQLELVSQNAELKTELRAAHVEIGELRAEVKALRSNN